MPEVNASFSMLIVPWEMQWARDTRQVGRMAEVSLLTFMSVAPWLRHVCFFSDSIAVLVFFLGTLAPSQAVLCSFYILQ